MATTLVEVEQLASQLTEADRRVLRNRLALLDAPPVSQAEADAAIAAFRAVCDQLAAGSRPGENMTEAVSLMRR